MADRSSGPSSYGRRQRANRGGGGNGDADDGDDTDAAQGAIGEIRSISANQTRVTMSLRKSDGDDNTPWITELVCLLFNAQGDVLRIHRGLECNTKPQPYPRHSMGNSNTDDDQAEADAIQIRRFESKDAVEKERITCSLVDLHPSVEVVGFLVTYATDEIARRPVLNTFHVRCDVSSATESEDDACGGMGGGKERRGLSLLQGGDAEDQDQEQRSLFTYSHDAPSVVQMANYVVLCKFYRDAENRAEWVFHDISASGIARSSVNPVLAEAMQVFLLDIIPEIEIANRNALNTVASICAALSRNEVLGIEAYFGDEGVTRDPFAKLLLVALLQSRPELQRLSRATSLVALLFEMFEQIDINGDGAVDWEEFTSFCVSLGLIATKQLQLGGSSVYGCTYHQLLVGPANKSSFAYQIRRIRTFPSLRITAVIENKADIVMMYDAAEMTFLHEFNHVARLCHEDNRELSILDIDYVASQNWLVVSSSDHSLTFWSVVNAASCAYVFAFKMGSRCPIPYIQWCGDALNRLVTVSSEGVQLWDIQTKRVTAKLTHHRDRLTACLEIHSASSLLLATCSFDTTIAVLHVPSLTLAFELRGHVQGIQQMDYLEHGGILLSSGFEHQAFCWSIPAQSLLTTLGGHQASLIGAKFVSHPANTSVAMVVTGDERGHFRLWDISRCLKGHSTDLATALQSFDLVTPNLCRFHTFACGIHGAATSSSTTSSSSLLHKKRRTDDNQQLADIITGSFRLYRFHAVSHVDETAPPRHVTFNSISNCFVGSVDGVISVWSAHSGAKIEEPIVIRDADVCAIVFDMPRQRKLFVATSDGAIRLYNPITAVMLTKTIVHDGRISELLYCPRSSCLVSTGYDRRISVSFSSAGKTDIDVLRTVDNAHDSCITAAAYSQDLELVATGDDAGNIHIYDFQRLYLLLRCDGHGDEIRALHFHHSAALLFSADATGVVYVWYVATTGVEYRTPPLMQLTLTTGTYFAMSERPGTTSSPTSRLGSRPSTSQKPPLAIVPSPVCSILSIAESKHAPAYVYLGTVNGAVWGWDFRMLTNHARKYGLGKCFEYRFQDIRSHRRDGGGGGDYNALLRVAHKASVLKFRPADVMAIVASSSGVFGKPAKAKQRTNDAAETVGDVLHSCEASYVWQAHTASVMQLHGLQYPGQVFSVSLDGSIKVWDPSHACIGVITTLATAKPPDSREPATTASSTWKFSYHHHLFTDAREQHIRIAREMLRRVKRRASRQQQKRCDSGCTYALSKELYDASAMDPVVVLEHVETTPLPPSLAAADKLLASQTPFSKESVRAGVHVGLFGVEESNLLRELALGPHKQTSQPQHQSRLAPLMLPSPTSASHHANKTKKSLCLDGKEHELPVMRTMQHFPVEMDRRRRQANNGRVTTQVDISLSPFLTEQLSQQPSPVFTPTKSRNSTGPKSTPKMRPAPSAPSAPAAAASQAVLVVEPPVRVVFHMDASVVVTENVTLLPLLHSPHISHVQSAMGGQEPTMDNHGQSPPSTDLATAVPRNRLASYASAPCLPVYHTDPSQQLLSVQTNIPADTTTTPGNSEAKRSNIERKMRIYEGAAGGLFHLTTKPLDSESEDTGTSNSDPSHQSTTVAGQKARVLAPRQMSQPQLSTKSRKVNPSSTSTTTGSTTPSASGKRASQGALTTSPSSTTSNNPSNSSSSHPFGPHYTTKQVLEFGGILARFDNDSSGDIDKSEWVRMLQNCRRIFGSADVDAAERLFHAIDRDDSGKISLQEILPMMFSKATPEQLQKMRQYIHSHVEAAAVAAGSATRSQAPQRL